MGHPESAQILKKGSKCPLLWRKKRLTGQKRGKSQIKIQQNKEWADWKGESGIEKERGECLRSHTANPFHLPSELLSHEASPRFYWQSDPPAAPQGAGVTLHLWSEPGPSVCQYELERLCVCWVNIRQRACVCAPHPAEVYMFIWEHSKVVLCKVQTICKLEIFICKWILDKDFF